LLGDIPKLGGVSLGTNLRDMREHGLRPFVVGTIGEGLIAISTLGLLVGTDKLFCF